MNSQKIKGLLHAGCLERVWRKLYGSFKQVISQQKRHYADAVDKFREGFPGDEANTYV